MLPRVADGHVDVNVGEFGVEVDQACRGRAEELERRSRATVYSPVV